jgi:hypothetical protein
MHAFGFLEQIVAGEFQAELLSLEITLGTGETMQGQGFLAWKKEVGSSIQAITNGGENLAARFLNTSGRVQNLGKLIRDEQYASLNAVTRDRKKISICRFDPDGYDVRTDSDAVLWRIPSERILSPIKLTSPVEDERPQCVELLLTGSTSFMWPRRTARNEECLELCCGIGTLRAIKSLHDYWHVSIDVHDDFKIAQVVQAVVGALSFWAGCLVDVVAFEAHSGVVEQSISCPPLLLQQRPIAPPLGHTTYLELAECHEPLLSKAIDYFALEGSGFAASALTAYLSSANGTFASHSLTTCAVLEGLAERFAAKKSLDVISEDGQARVVRLLEGDGFGQSIVERFRGFMGMLNRVTGSNVLADAAKNGHLGITLEEWRSWKNLRNPSAHGKFAVFVGSYEAKQSKLHERSCVYNLINKLLLHEIGYRGKFFDYRTWTIGETD